MAAVAAMTLVPVAVIFVQEAEVTLVPAWQIRKNWCLCLCIHGFPLSQEYGLVSQYSRKCKELINFVLKLLCAW
jgi:hypothetical protein